MDDNELNKLFSGDESSPETSPETDKAPLDKEAEVSEQNSESSEEKKEEDVVVEESDGGQDSDKETKKEKPEDDPEVKAKLEREKQERKRQARLEKIRKIEEFERNIEAKNEARRIHREEMVPLSERVYLEDFPMSFKSVMLVLLILVVLVFAWSIVFHPFFRVTTVHIQGNHELTDDQVMDALGIEYGSHLFSSYYSEGRELRSTNPYVSSVSVKRVFPSTLEINVNERKKIAYISTPDGYIAIDDQGVVLEFSADTNAEVAPLLCGLNINSATLGQRVDILEDRDFRKMIIVLSAALSAGQGYDGNHSGNFDYDFFGSIKEVRIVSSGVIFITVTLPEGADLQVKLKDINTITDDMHWLVYAIEESSFEGLPDGVLDMTGDEYIYREYGY